MEDTKEFQNDWSFSFTGFGIDLSHSGFIVSAIKGHNGMHSGPMQITGIKPERSSSFIDLTDKNFSRWNHQSCMMG